GSQRLPLQKLHWYQSVQALVSTVAVDVPARICYNRSREGSMLAKLVKTTSDFLARSPGLLVGIGMGLIGLNFILQLLPAWPVIGWMARTHLWLHVGLLLSLFGLLVARVL
ncbi:MAG: hypothetical protein N2556_08125, partial [Anaerolineae bacterium]|nr:hypothetical protein [Anaerolineae bacterium]